ncbi:hypothetical protein D7D25_12325 [Proteiniphilum sp. X52]|nr:hypothetical protein D7D25_12325 [Proteiniphilum sp. X52]
MIEFLFRLFFWRLSPLCIYQIGYQTLQRNHAHTIRHILQASYPFNIMNMPVTAVVEKMWKLWKISTTGACDSTISTM